MAHQLVDYKQTDPRWRNKSYAVKGKENSTIGGSGCGPTCVAMIAATLIDPTITPVDTCRWALEHGHKAVGQGTYYTFFEAYFKAHGMKCHQAAGGNGYHKSGTKADKEALQALKDGKYVIACMGAGTWTSAGHFIVLRTYKNGKVIIQDPASTRPERLKNSWDKVQYEAKYYFIVEPVVQLKVTVASANIRYMPTKQSKRVAVCKKGKTVNTVYGSVIKGNRHKIGQHQWIHVHHTKPKAVA